MRSTLKCTLGAALAIALAASVATACQPPMVLVDQAFMGEKRTAKIVMQQSGEGHFDEYIRICDLKPDGTETNCKDTLVLENVVAGSLY